MSTLSNDEGLSQPIQKLAGWGFVREGYCPALDFQRSVKRNRLTGSVNFQFKPCKHVFYKRNF